MSWKQSISLKRISSKIADYVSELRYLALGEAIELVNRLTSALVPGQDKRPAAVPITAANKYQTAHRRTRVGNQIN
jgi:hypothetical protein